MQKNKFKIQVLKTTILDTGKSMFLVFEVKPPKKLLFVFRLWFSFKNNRRTNVLLVAFFEKALKKLLTVKNTILAVFGGY